MSSTSLSYLISTIQALPEVQSQSLLKSRQWRKSGFQLLSQMIHTKLARTLDVPTLQSLGSSISPRTLTKIFTNNYPVEHPLDPRTKNTLDKLAIYAGFEGWEEVGHKMEAEWEQQGEGTEEVLKKQMVHALARRKEALCGSQSDIMDLLDTLYTADGSACKKILAMHQMATDKGWILHNDYNPSTIDILQCDLRQDGDVLTITTRESWIICWWSTNEHKYVYRYQRQNIHEYSAVKVKNGWKLDVDASQDDILDVLLQ